MLSELGRVQEGDLSQLEGLPEGFWASERLLSLRGGLALRELVESPRKGLRKPLRKSSTSLSPKACKGRRP